MIDKRQSTMSFGKSRAVVILANDNVATWLTACLNSLRRNSRDIPCYIIPFDDCLERVRTIAKRHDAVIVAPPHLQDLQAIGGLFYPTNPVAQRMFGKLSAFFVGVDEVLYSDADVVFLRPVEAIFDAFEASGMDLLYADSNINTVYAEASFQRRMMQDYGAQGINSGFWIARGDLFSFEDFRALADQAQTVKQCFDQTGDQPFLNYCLDVTHTPYGHLSLALEGFPPAWGGLEAHKRDGQWYCTTGSTPLYVMHWAGTGYSSWGMTNRRIFFEALLLGRNFLAAAGIRLWWFLDHVRRQNEPPVKKTYRRFRSKLGRTRLRQMLKSLASGLPR
jgi:hypothetical protein